MAKYNRAPRIRKSRRWFKNVGDPIDLIKRGQTNPNDGKVKA
jgi:hypothetical protein